MVLVLPRIIQRWIPPAMNSFYIFPHLRPSDFFGDFYSLNKSFLPAENERCDLDVERLEEFLGNLLSIIESGNQGEGTIEWDISFTNGTSFLQIRHVFFPEMAKEIFDAIKRMAEELQTVADLNPERYVFVSRLIIK